MKHPSIGGRYAVCGQGLCTPAVPFSGGREGGGKRIRKENNKGPSLGTGTSGEEDGD